MSKAKARVLQQKSAVPRLVADGQPRVVHAGPCVVSLALMYNAMNRSSPGPGAVRKINKQKQRDAPHQAVMRSSTSRAWAPTQVPFAAGHPHGPTRPRRSAALPRRRAPARRAQRLPSLFLGLLLRVPRPGSAAAAAIPGQARHPRRGLGQPPLKRKRRIVLRARHTSRRSPPVSAGGTASKLHARTPAPTPALQQTPRHASCPGAPLAHAPCCQSRWGRCARAQCRCRRPPPCKWRWAGRARRTKSSSRRTKTQPAHTKAYWIRMSPTPKHAQRARRRLLQEVGPRRGRCAPWRRR